MDDATYILMEQMTYSPVEPSGPLAAQILGRLKVAGRAEVVSGSLAVALTEMGRLAYVAEACRRLAAMGLVEEVGPGQFRAIEKAGS